MTVQPPSSTTSSSPPAGIQRSQWNSPVPYLFGGLAAMLILIAFALLILAISYWKLSGQMNNGDEVDTDIESSNGDGDAKPESYMVTHVFEEKYLVIMAGQVKPTFLATPISGRDTTSLGSRSSQSNLTAKSELELRRMEKQGNHESSNQ